MFGGLPIKQKKGGGRRDRQTLAFLFSDRAEIAERRRVVYWEKGLGHQLELSGPGGNQRCTITE